MLAYGFLAGKGPQWAVECGAAHGALAMTTPGDTSMATVAAAVTSVGKFTSHNWIGDVDVPVAVLVTTRDSVVPTSRQMKLAHAIPHATVINVEGDHGVFVATPRLFADKILEACRAVYNAPPRNGRVLPWRPA